jgi:OmpA-OmpF porin, OOP family
MKYPKFAGACLLACGLAGGVAHADDDAGFYLGTGIGQAREKSGPFEGSDTSFRVFGGYSFNRFFAAEAGYIDGGNIDDDIGPYRVSIASEGLYAAGLAKLPLGDNFELFAKLGWVFHDSTETVSLGSQRNSESTSDSDFLFGGGVALKLGKNFQLRAEYDKVNVSDAAFDIFSVNAAWKF